MRRSYSYGYKFQNIPRTGLKVGDVFRCSSSRFPKYAIDYKAVVVEKYKRLNGFNRRYWNYYTIVEMLDGPYPGRRTTIVNLSKNHVSSIHDEYDESDSFRD